MTIGECIKASTLSDEQSKSAGLLPARRENTKNNELPAVSQALKIEKVDRLKKSLPQTGEATSI